MYILLLVVSEKDSPSTFISQEFNTLEAARIAAGYFNGFEKSLPISVSYKVVKK